MTDEIRSQVRAAMGEQGVSQEQLAKTLGIARPNLTGMLSGQSGQIPDRWARLFAELGLKLIAVPAEQPTEPAP